MSHDTADTSDAGRTGVRILVVDDQPGMREGLGMVLRRAGYDVYLAETAAAAEACMRTTPCELALIDIVLPDGDGMKLCEGLKAAHDVDVILMTGKDGRYSFADAMGSGAADFIAKPFSFEEALLRSDKALEARRTREDMGQLIDQLQRQAVTDSLTGLYNSRHFFSRLEEEVSRCRRYGNELCLLVLDLDHFKQINDGLGHQEGDKVLRLLADVFRRSLRLTDTCFRYGGEEFAVMLPDSDKDAGIAAAARLNRTVRELGIMLPGPEGAPLTVSIGLASLSPGEDMYALLRRADLAMYEAKRCGRDRVMTSDDPQPPQP